MPQYDTIAFLSDMGTRDESVGVCKAVMIQQAPHATILDISHDVPAFDVRAGALALTRAIQFLPAGIIVAAVDPGSPRDQRYIAVEMEQGVLIGPDNGILAPAAQLIGEPRRVHEISNLDFRIDAPGSVFSARDILAPAAGVIAAGVDLAELGPQIPLDQLVPGMLQLARHDEGGAFLGEVWSVDRFGNVQVNITPEEIGSRGAKVGDTVIVRIGETDHIAKYVERYADLAVSQLGILVDSTGMISVVKNLDFASKELDVKEGKAITILPPNTSVTGRDITIESLSQSAPLPEKEHVGNPTAVTLPLTPPPDLEVPQAGAVASPGVTFIEPAVAAQPPQQSIPVYEGHAPAPETFSDPQQPVQAAPAAPQPYGEQPPVASPQPEAPAPDAFGSILTPQVPVEPAFDAQPLQPYRATPQSPEVQAPPVPPVPSVPSEPPVVSVPPVPESVPAYFPPAEQVAPVGFDPPVHEQPQTAPATPASMPENVFDLFKGDEEEVNVDNRDQ